MEKRRRKVDHDPENKVRAAVDALLETYDEEEKRIFLDELRRNSKD